MSPQEKQPVKKREFKWGTVLWAIHLHVLAIYAIWLLITSAKWMTLFYTIFLVALATLAITAGAHRMWAHNMYKGTSLLRLFFMMAYTLAGTGTIYDWVLRHRFHHKYYGTDKDFYNHKKGFLYSHYVSNVLKENVDVEEMKRIIDMRDMEGDIFVWIQKQFYWPVFLIVGLILPLNAPLAYWDETMTETIVITGLLRFAITMNVSWLVNSARIVWGVEKGKNISQNSPLSFIITKSFWPIYHYLAPWDWQCGEFGSYGTGCTTFFIKMFYELDLVNTLKTTNTEDVREMLYRIATKKGSFADSLQMLKEKSTYRAMQEKLKVRR